MFHDHPQFSIGINQLHLSDHVRESLCCQARPMAEHGIAAPIGDHHCYDVSREGPARLVTPVQHMQVGGGCPHLDKSMLATFKLFNDLYK